MEFGKHRHKKISVSERLLAQDTNETVALLNQLYLCSETRAHTE